MWLCVKVSKEQHHSFRDLVWHLIYARDITNELEKARFVLNMTLTVFLPVMKCPFLVHHFQDDAFLIVLNNVTLLLSGVLLYALLCV